MCQFAEILKHYFTDSLQNVTSTAYICSIPQSELKHHKQSLHNFESVNCLARDLESSDISFLKQINRGRQTNEKFVSVDDFKNKVDITEELNWERKCRTNSKNYNSIIGPDRTGVCNIDLICPGGVHITIGLVNNAYKDIISELDESDLNAVAVEVKDVIEKTKVSGGCGATPGKAHGGELNGGDCLDLVLLYDRVNGVIPEGWSRKQDWLNYFSCLKCVLPPLNRCRFWSDREI